LASQPHKFFSLDSKSNITQKSNYDKKDPILINITVKMVSITFFLSTILAIASTQVTAAPSPQGIGSPDAIAEFYSNCTNNDQSGIPAQDQVIVTLVTPACTSFAFNGIDVSLEASGCTGKMMPHSYQ
jgi:hypothetical protein